MIVSSPIITVCSNVLIVCLLSLTLPHLSSQTMLFFIFQSKKSYHFCLLIAFLLLTLEEVLDVEVAPEAEPEEVPGPEQEVHEEGIWHAYSFILPYLFPPQIIPTVQDHLVPKSC